MTTMNNEDPADPSVHEPRVLDAAQEARLVDHAYAEGRKDEREATLAEFAALLPGPYYMDPPDGGSVTVLEQFRRMALDAQRLRAENAALKREAHTWWTAARDAAMDERARCALRVALHSQYPITTDFDRGYDKARKDAAEMLRTMGDDAGLELGPNAKLSGPNGPQEKQR